jgi:uncharacterized protein HemX
MKTVITALVALVIGAGGMYFYQQGSMKQFQTQLTEAKTAAEAATGEVAKLQEAATAAAAELADVKSKAEASVAEMTKAMDQKVQEATALQSKVTELEAALTAAKSGTGTAQ